LEDYLEIPKNLRPEKYMTSKLGFKRNKPPRIIDPLLDTLEEYNILKDHSNS
jgi:hypothetical protein